MTAPLRIMRVKLSPQRRGARVFATLSPTDKAAAIALTSGNLVATGSGVAWGVARATLPIAGGQHYWETTYAFAGATDVAAGIATADATLTARLGSGVGGTAGPDRLGDFWRDGIKVLDLGSLSTGVVIRHWLDADAGVYCVAIGGGSWNEVTANPASSYRVWYPAVALLGNASCSANFGQSPFVYAAPSGARAGVYDDPLETVDLYVSSGAVNTGPDDTPANQPYQARIAAGTDVEIEREGSCWVWGNQTRSSRGSLTLILDRSVQWWGSLLWRDAEVLIDRGLRTLDGDTWSEWTVCIVEKAEATDRQLTLTLTDELARLDRNLQTVLYPADVANTQIMHRPKPVCLGRPLYVEGLLLDTSKFGGLAFARDVHDGELLQIDAIYDKGDVFDPSDWSYLPSRTGFKLVYEPDGKVVCLPRGATVAVSIVVDETNGGDFDDWSVPGAVDDDPAGWIVTGEDVFGSRYVQDNGGARLLSSDATPIAISKGAIVPGSYYRVDVDVVDVSIGTLSVGTDTEQPIVLDAVGPQTFVFQAAADSTTFVISGSACDLTITAVRVRELRLIEYLRDWLYYLIVTRGGRSADKVDWDTIDTLADSTRTPRRLAYYATQPVNIQALLRLTLDGWCAWMHTSRAGLLTVRRVDRPSGTPSVRLDRTNLVSAPRRSDDDAKGLTTLLAGARNYTPHDDADFVSPLPDDPGDGDRIAAMRSEFTIVRSGMPSTAATGDDKVSPMLRQAEGATPKETLFQVPDDVQVEASRVASLWRASPDNWECDAVLSHTDADALEPGDTVLLQYDGIDELQDGRLMFVRRVRSGFFGNVVRLLLWNPEGQ